MACTDLQIETDGSPIHTSVVANFGGVEVDISEYSCILHKEANTSIVYVTLVGQSNLPIEREVYVTSGAAHV